MEWNPGELIWFDPGIGHWLPGEVLECHKSANVLTVQAVINGKVCIKLFLFCIVISLTRCVIKKNIELRNEEIR